MSPIPRIAAVATTAVAIGIAAPSMPTSLAASGQPTTHQPAAAAAGYLARHLRGHHHDHYVASYKDNGTTVKYVNYGETADAVLSMDAAGVAQHAAKRATAYLAKHVTTYAGDATSGYSPGAIGKLMLVAEAQHNNVRSFGGVDLVAAVASTEGSGGAQPGEYQQNPPGTDPSQAYYSTVGQALPVLALAGSPQAGDQPDAAAVTFLADQQCADGGFPTQLQTDPSTACQAGSDIDSTGYAVQALLATGQHDAAQRGLAFLKRSQRKSGGFGTVANANSTALAVEALLAGHRSVTKATRWLVGQQVGCGSRHAGRRGAVRFSKGYDAAAALLATSQAGAALAGRPLAWIDKAGAHGAAPTLACPKRR